MLGATEGQLLPGTACGILGAVVGTVAGYEFRMRLADRLGNDHPAAVIEDAIAITTAAIVA